MDPDQHHEHHPSEQHCGSDRLTPLVAAPPRCSGPMTSIHRHDGIPLCRVQGLHSTRPTQPLPARQPRPCAALANYEMAAARFPPPRNFSDHSERRAARCHLLFQEAARRPTADSGPDFVFVAYAWAAFASTAGPTYATESASRAATVPSVTVTSA